MKYNGPEWYAACVASFMCLIIFVIFLNVIQFEIYNRLEVCHPYFYQSSACRKLIAHGISSNPSFTNMKNDFSKKTFRQTTSATSTVKDISDKANNSNINFIREINQVNDVVQNLGPVNLGKLKKTMSSSASPSPSVLNQIKTLLDQTIIDPTMTKYIDPLKRLYTSLQD